MSSGFKTVDLSIDYTTELTHRLQGYNYERGNIEAYYAEKIIVLKLAGYSFGGLLGVKDTVFFSHTAGLVDDQNNGPVLFLALWLFWFYREDGFDRRATITSRSEAGFSTKHQKTIALSGVAFNGGKIVGGKLTPVDIIEDDDSIAPPVMVGYQQRVKLPQSLAV